MPTPMSSGDEYAAAFDEEPGTAGANTPPEGDAGGIDPTAATQETQDGGNSSAAPSVAVVIDPKAGEIGGKAGQSEAVEEVVEAVESGDMTLEQAMKMLADDFGPEFPRLLRVLMKAEAAEAVKPVATTVDDVIAHIADSRQRAHFEAIADAHPDFMEVANSDAMKNYLGSLPEDQKAEAEDVIKCGSAKKIIALLDAVKESGEQANPAVDTSTSGADDEFAMDAASGVRSGGLRIPEKPKASDDYEKAWDQF